LSNISRTYVWVNRDAPQTERFQFLGDPRHNPYLDVFQDRRVNQRFNGSNAVSAANINTANDYYPGYILSDTGNGDNSNTDVDIPRFFQMYRESFANSTAVYNSLTGYSSWMYGIGGEISLNPGFNSQQFQFKGIPFNDATSREAWTNWADSNSGGGLKVIAKSDDSWGAKTWLGELYPDSNFDSATAVSWLNKGNLPSIGTGDKFYRKNIASTSIAASSETGTAIKLNNTSGRVTNDRGPSIFFNGSPDASRTYKFIHHTNDVSELLTQGTDALGKSIFENYGFSLPANVTADRTFSISATGGSPMMWNDPIYYNNRTKTSLVDTTKGCYTPTLIEQPSDTTSSYRPSAAGSRETRYIGSATIKVELPYFQIGRPNTFYVAMNGFKAPRTQGKAFILKYALSASMEAFLGTGDITNQSVTVDTSLRYKKSTQIPRVKILDRTTSPSGDSPIEAKEVKNGAIEIDWLTNWKKWDGSDYSIGYRNKNWKETDVTVYYHVLASSDSGSTWKYINTSGSLGATAKAGVLDLNNTSALVTCDSSCLASTDVVKTINWDVSSLPQGSYLFRIEAFRKSNTLNTSSLDFLKQHYSYHQREVFIRN
ncbi:MAG: hypothetical protein ACK4IX_05610, partial [Candidatus Sericytochromatia bacterium]